MSTSSDAKVTIPRDDAFVAFDAGEKNHRDVYGEIPTIGDAEEEPAKKSTEEEEPSKKAKIARVVLALTFFVCVTLTVSIVSYVIALRLGTHSMANLGDQLQEQIANGVKTELDRRLDPIAIFLKSVVDFIDENEIDVEDNAQLRQVMPVAHSFLRNYFDDSRCCFGAFVNMHGGPTDRGPIQGTDVLNCHAIEAPGCDVPKTLYNPKAQWVGVLHFSDTYAQESGFFSQVLPLYPAGNATNELYFKSYEGKLVMNASNPEKHNGFVPFPYGDGYWFWLNVKHDLKKKDVMFAPVFPFDLYKPIVLKTHATTPLYSRDGRRVGAMVTGFKLHWVSKFLASLAIKKGMFTLIVERGTGHVVASSNTSWVALDAKDKPIHARNLAQYDEQAAMLAGRMVANANGDWTAVTAHRATSVVSSGSGWDNVLFGTQSRDDFIIVFEYKKLGIDWIGGIYIPYASIMSDIDENEVSLGTATVVIGVLIRVLGKMLELAAGFLLFRACSSAASKPASAAKSS